MDTSMLEPRVEFYGVKVLAGKASQITPQPSSLDGTSISIHLTQVALGSDAAAGPHTVFAVKDKSSYAIGTLEKGRCEQFAVDYMSTTNVVFKHSGPSDVYLTGYR